MLLCSITVIYTQDRKTEETPAIFYEPEQFPDFPGGAQAMMKFIADSLRYPSQEANVQGRVVLRFLVKADGAIDSISVLRGIHPDFDKEAVRIVKSMPRWIPGKRKGLDFGCWYTLPIIFRIKDNANNR